MDRFDAMQAFVVTVDAGSLSAAARTLGRSAASVTRAVGGLEARLGVQLLRRTTRTLKLTEAGDRYLAVARRVLAEIAEAEKFAGGPLDAPRGRLTVTAPSRFGTLHVRPVVDDFLEAHAGVQSRLLLVDRVVDLVGEGVDVAVRIAHLPDSALVAVRLGEVRRLVCASPAYLARHGKPKTPADLAAHRCISFTGLTPNDTWAFGGSGRRQHVKVRPTLSVNAVEAAIGSALEGRGLVRALSYQVALALRAGELVPLLGKFELPALPVHLVYPAGSTSAAKVRSFVELAVPRLRAALS